MTQLRITLVIKTAEGGRWIIPHIEEMLRRGHKVAVILPDMAGRLRDMLERQPIDISPIDFDFSLTPSVSTIQGLRRLRLKIRESRPDVVHYHLYASALATRMASLGVSNKRVHMVAGPLYLDSLLIRTAERMVCRLDSILVAGSGHTAERYERLGYPKQRMAVIPYGVDIERFRTPSLYEVESARDSLGVAPGQFVVVMIAYFYGPKKMVHQGVGIKGHDVLLAGWKEFAESRSDVKLFIVGSGFDPAGEEHRSALMTQYADPRLGIQWLASVSDVRPYYWAANLSVSPSLSENHGSALEAGACGVPRLVSDAGGLPETTTSESGWVVPRGSSDALRCALEEAYDEFRKGTLARRGLKSRYEMVRSFDVSEASTRLVDILEGCAQKNAPRLSNFAVALRDSTKRQQHAQRPLVPAVGRRYATVVKRSLDFLSACALLVASAPIQVFVSIGVALRLGRPVLFRQVRPGRDGKLFTLIKFRTMKNPDPSRGLVSDEERMTRFGSWLRSTSLDELPTLWNVLRGDMSMIGPRPLLPQYLDLYTPAQARRHEVRPGVTGLAQVSGRNALDWEAKLALDADYVDNLSLKNDVRILLRTFRALVLREGIHEPGHITVREFRGSREKGLPDE